MESLTLHLIRSPRWATRAEDKLINMLIRIETKFKSAMELTDYKIVSLLFDLRNKSIWEGGPTDGTDIRLFLIEHRQVEQATKR